MKHFEQLQFSDLKSSDIVIICDRDGTIIEEKEYLSNPDDIVFLPGALEGLKLMNHLGHKVVIVSNQSGVGRGYFSFERMNEVNGRILKLLEAEGVEISGVYCCVHHPDDNCDCRKPKAGLVLMAAEEIGFDPENTIVIGDKTSDIDLAQTLNSFPILLRTGYGKDTEKLLNGFKGKIVKDLLEASEYISKSICARREVKLTGKR